MLYDSSSVPRCSPSLGREVTFVIGPRAATKLNGNNRQVPLRWNVIPSTCKGICSRPSQGAIGALDCPVVPRELVEWHVLAVASFSWNGGAPESR